MRVLVTGSNGTVGTALCERLIESPETPHIVDGIDAQPAKYSQDIGELTRQIDLKNFSDTLKSVKEVNPDIVVHLANHARVANLVERPDLSTENMTMNFNIIEACRQAGVQRFVMASSREVYGNQGLIAPPRKEHDFHLIYCESPYSASKIQGEALCHAYRQCYGMETAIVRLSNVYGKYDFSDRVVPLWIKNIYKGRPMIIYGEEKTLDFTYIDDAALGLNLIIDHFDDKNLSSHTFNIASGESIKLIKVALMLGEVTGKDPIIQVKKNKPGEVVNYCADISAATETLGYSPGYDIRTGLHRAVNWYKEVGYVQD